MRRKVSSDFFMVSLVRGLVVQLHQRVLVKLGATHAQHHGFEGGEVLPVLPPCATGIRPAALSLSAAAKNSSQVLGMAATPAFFSASELAQIQFTRCTLTGRPHSCPCTSSHRPRPWAAPRPISPGLGQGVHVAQHAFRCPFLNGRALDLRGRWGFSRNHAALEHRHGAVAAAAGHGKVTPGVALGLHHLLSSAADLASRRKSSSAAPPPHPHVQPLLLPGSRHSGDFVQFPHIPLSSLFACGGAPPGLLRSAQPVL